MGQVTRSSRLVVAGSVFALALLVRLIVLAQVSRDSEINRLSGDGRAYATWADTIASGNWLRHEVFYQAPLYPYFLAILKSLGIGLTGIRIVQAILGSLGCALVALATA